MIDSSSHFTTQSQGDQEKACSCEEFLHSKIRSANTISFAEFMADSLYHPSLGYYSSQAPRVGKDGDFFTSVSVGQAFGSILASRILAFWQEIGSPEVFSIIEAGANDASLCLDILDFLKNSPLAGKIHYHIIEPLAHLSHRQKKNIVAQNLDNIVQYHTSFEDISDQTGVFLSNELFDAFPVEIIKKEQETWKRKMIKSEDSSFISQWSEIEANTELADFTSELNSNFPKLTEGYTTEFRPGLGNYLKAVSKVIKNGLFLAIDYGFPHSHYYDEKRSEGTLQTYYKHQKDDDPLILAGEKDITAHVDFTQLANAAIDQGFKVFDFSPQYRYLTHHGKPWLQSLEQNFTPGCIPLIKQFQTLTHPDMMGNKFHVLELTKGIQLSSPPTTLRPEEVLELT